MARVADLYMVDKICFVKQRGADNASVNADWSLDHYL